MSTKVISESSRPPGGSLINVVAFLAARKHNTELQPCSVKSSIANRAKETQGSSEDATLLLLCVSSQSECVSLQPQVRHTHTHIQASPRCPLSILSGGKCNQRLAEPCPALQCLLSFVTSLHSFIHFLTGSCWDYQEKRCSSRRGTTIHVGAKDYHEDRKVTDWPWSKPCTHTT